MRPVLVNGVPKSGKHGFLRALESLGLHVEDGIIKDWGGNLRFKQTDYRYALKDRGEGPPERVYHGEITTRNRHLTEPAIHILVLRDPRDCLISAVRWMAGLKKGRAIDDAQVIEEMQGFLDSKPSLVKICRGFVGYLTDSHANIFYFKDLYEKYGEYERLAQIVEADPNPELWAELMGWNAYPLKRRDGVIRSTWSGEHSDWRTSPLWTPAVAKAWTKEGGDDVVQEMGFEV